MLHFPMPKWVLRLLILACLIVAAVMLTRQWNSRDPVPVKVVSVAFGTVEDTITNSRAGTVKARRRAKLSSEVGGRVIAVPYRKGDHVREGERLLQLNDATERAALELAKRDLAVTRANRKRACLEASRAHREYARFRDLSQKDLISTDELDHVENTAKTAVVSCQAADASIERAETRIRSAQAELKKLALYAPFPGVLAEVTVEVGEWTTPSPPGVPIPPVLDLIDPRSIFVSAPMDEVDSSKIRTDQIARVTLDSYPGQSRMGRVVRVAPYVEDLEEQNRTVEVDVELDDVEFAATLLPGTSADVEIVLSSQDRVLRVPRSGLVEGSRVWVVENDRVAERSVQVGIKNWDYVEIHDGLSEGDTVIVGVDHAVVEPGYPVTVIEHDAP